MKRLKVTAAISLTVVHYIQGGGGIPAVAGEAGRGRGGGGQGGEREGELPSGADQERACQEDVRSLRQTI